MNDQLYIYQGYTLVDITPTGQTTFTLEHELERNQQRNWETVLQIVSLRTQPTLLETENTITDIHGYSFGINYTGKHRIWTFKFTVDYAEIFRSGADLYGLLKSDFKLTQIILGLTDTAQPDQPIFYTSGPWKNVYFNAEKA